MAWRDSSSTTLKRHGSFERMQATDRWSRRSPRLARNAAHGGWIGAGASVVKERPLKKSREWLPGCRRGAVIARDGVLTLRRRRGGRVPGVALGGRSWRRQLTSALHMVWMGHRSWRGPHRDIGMARVLGHTRRGFEGWAGVAVMSHLAWVFRPPASKSRKAVVGSAKRAAGAVELVFSAGASPSVCRDCDAGQAALWEQNESARAADACSTVMSHWKGLPLAASRAVGYLRLPFRSRCCWGSGRSGRCVRPVRAFLIGSE